MNVAFRRPMSLDEFLEWEEQQELRYEFDGFQPVAMTGGTFAHAEIAGNVFFILKGFLQGKPCRAINSDLKILVDGHIRYPDVFVVCTPVAPNATVVSEPVIIFEVLSKSTAHTDLAIKSVEYGATQSVRRYIILEQDRIAAKCFSRANGAWEPENIKQGGSISLPEVGLKIALADVYAGIEFPSDLAVDE